MRASINKSAAILILFFSTGCGTIGGDDGGSENLPNRGVAPYRPVGEILRDATSPSAIVDGREVVLYFERTGSIFSVRGDGLRFDGPEMLVRTNAGQPSVTADRLAYVEAGGAIEVVALSDPSVLLNRIDAVAGSTLAEPSLAGDALYYERDGAIILDGAVIKETARTPEIRVAKSATGRTIYRLMYTALDEEETPVIAFSASFDGVSFTDLSINPLLPGSHPSNIYFEKRYLLYYVENGGISVAENVPAAPSETF